MGTSGRMCGDLGLEMRDLRTSSMGRGDVGMGTQGHQIQGCRGRGM